MKKLYFILFLACTYSAFSQSEFKFKVNGGLSQINSKIYANGSINTQKFDFAPSAQAGLVFNQHLGKRSLIGVELLFMQIEGKEHMNSQTTDAYGNPTGFLTTTDISRHISYLGLPIYYGFKVKKFTINLGVQVNLTLTSAANYKTEYIYNGNKITTNNKYNSLPIDNLDFGTKAGLIYNLSKMFSVEAMYYYGLNNIYKYGDITFGNPRPLFNIKVQQVTVGIAYKFYSKKKKNG